MISRGIENKKATGFRSPQVKNYCGINQVISKCQTFWTKLAKKGVKHKKWLSPSNYRIRYLGTEFQVKLTILDFWTKMYFRSKKGKKNENHHRILHFELAYKFHVHILRLSDSEQTGNKLVYSSCIMSCRTT